MSSLQSRSGGGKRRVRADQIPWTDDLMLDGWPFVRLGIEN